MSASEATADLVPVTIMFQRDNDERIFVIRDFMMPEHEIGRREGMEAVLTAWGRLDEHRLLKFVGLAKGAIDLKITGENLASYVQGYLVQEKA